MELGIVLEQRFERTPDGAVWTRVGYPYEFWMRYRMVFPRLRIVARVRDIPRVGPEHRRVDGEGVSVAAVPHYLGPYDFLRKRSLVRAAVCEEMRPGSAVLLRVPGVLGTIAAKRLLKLGYPFGLEVVGDPHDVFAPGAVRHPLRPFLRRSFTRDLRTQCLHAVSALYVTERALQSRYPCLGGMVGVSDVELPHSAFAAAPRQSAGSALNVVFIGSLEQLYKSPDVLLRACARTVAMGVDLRVTMIGEGRYRAMLERLAAQLGLQERAVFLGQLPAGAAVREQLDSADLFVLPSRTEGMPRALIEAMARALPCVGSNVGGIPELLPPEMLVPPGDVDALAGAIRALAGNPGLRRSMARRNLERARDFGAEGLQRKRESFLRRLAESTQAWLVRKAA